MNILKGRSQMVPANVMATDAEYAITTMLIAAG
jgi:hypothetical protein